MATPEPDSERIVIADTNILINLVIAGDLSILSRIPDRSFVVCGEVLSELLRTEVQQSVRTAIDSGDISTMSIDTVPELQTFAELRAVMGLGEAASLALAQHRKLSLASDEKRVFRREAIRLLGDGRLVTTPDIYILAIRARIVTVEQADAAKRKLQENRFRMGFGSFSEIVPE